MSLSVYNLRSKDHIESIFESSKEKVELTTKCPMCGEQALCYRFKTKKGKEGLSLKCFGCSSTIFSTTGIILTAVKNYPIHTKLVKMNYLEFSDLRKKLKKLNLI